MVVFKLTPYLLQILQFTSNGALSALALSTGLLNSALKT